MACEYVVLFDPAREGAIYCGAPTRGVLCSDHDSPEIPDIAGPLEAP